ncbi:MAG: GAF domain-containing sensor histidine kinase [Anaerolineae bacterium]|nr:GAF domain-containing sensor histidine kinase [Anaerolineae bacterium]
MTEQSKPPDQSGRLKQDNLRLSHDLAQLQTIARIIVDEPGQADLLIRLSEHIARLLKTKRVMIGTLVDDAIVFEQMIEDGRPQAANRQFRPGEGLAGRVMINKQPYLGSNTSVDPAAGERYAVLAVPILNHQRHLLGVIECHKPPYSLPFTQKDAALVQTIALQMTPGLERALLFGQMERWAGSFENLLTFNANLNGKLEPAILIRRLVEHAAGFLGANAGLAGLVDGEEIVTDGYWQNGRWRPLDLHWPPLETACTPGWVLVNQCPYITDSYRDDTLANYTLLETFGVKNALCVPIMDAREDVLGFVELHNKAGGREPFTWSDAHFLESLANSTAVSIYNAQLLDELETQRSRLRAFAARNLTLLEDERRRIARELHDEAGQVMIGIKLELQVLAQKVAASAPELREEFDRLRRKVNESTAQIKEIGRALRPPVLDQLGLEAALNRFIADFQDRAGLPIHFEPVGLTARLPQPVETACYRLVQEALTNVVRHAQAEQVWISLTVEDQHLYLSVVDDGCGFAPKEMAHAGLGLLGMQERITMFSGTFTVESAPGAGTTINAVIPVPANHASDTDETNILGRSA